MFFMFNVSLVMIFSGLFVFCSNRKHFLLMLLSLEFIVLSLYFFIMSVLSFYYYEFFLSMIFLTLSVCEGALGLSILVSMVRTHSSGNYSMFNVLW